MLNKHWTDLGKTEADKMVGKTWTDSEGKLRCNECCNRDYGDGEECNHIYWRPKCPYCLGTGVNAATEPNEFRSR